MLLTDKFLRNLKPDTTIKEHSDGLGLSIRVSPGGSLSFQWRYRFHGKPRRIRYGSYPSLSLKEARFAHNAARRLLDQGVDPAAARLDARRKDSEAATVNDLIAEFKESYVKENHTSDFSRFILDGDVAPALGTIKAASVTRRDVINMLDRIVKRGSRVKANRAASLTKLLFQWGVERGLLEINPAADIKRRSVGGQEKSRDRVLTPSEIRAAWTKASTANMSRQTVLVLRLLLVTGQRRGELAKALKSDVDLCQLIWIIPAHNSKNGKAHKVPLSPLAAQLFRVLIKMAGDSDYVLPSQDGSTHATEMSISRAVARSIEKIGVEKWTPHDLRRTAATGMAELGVAPHVVEKVLNHTMQGVMAIYNRYDYLDECRLALNNWGSHVLEVLREGSRAVDEKKAERQPEGFSPSGA